MQDSARKEVILKQPRHYGYYAFLLLLWLPAAMLFCGCNPPLKNNSSGQAPQNSQNNETSGTTAAGSYLVIPLTSGNVSPISACSYDLLNTVCTIQLYDSTDYTILNECFALIYEYETLFSRTLAESEVSSVNAASYNSSDAAISFTISEQLRDILELSLYYGNLSHGALDVSIGSLSSLWDFSNPEHTSLVPSEASIQEALPLVNYEKILLDGNTLTFQTAGMQLELGAVAKGYIADRVKEFLLSQGVTSAIINLGGNILLVGEKPDGTAFHVGIQKPFESRDSVVAAITELKNCSMVSSGIYERYFYDAEGNFYHHILNPETGYPCDTGLLQVTIVSPDSVTGDALSTACFALGLTKGMELIHSLENVYAVFITSDGELHFSDGFLENIPTQTN